MCPKWAYILIQRGETTINKSKINCMLSGEDLWGKNI